MTLPIVKRYLIAFEQYKWAGLSTFMLALGVSGAVTMILEPPEAPPYTANGVLTYQNPPVLFSQTGQSIRERGQQLDQGMLLQPRVVESVMATVNVTPKELKDHLKVNVKNEAEAPSFIQVSFRDRNRERAVEIVNVMMGEMIEQSRLINTQHLRDIIDTVTTRLEPVEQELRQAEKALEEYDKREGATLLAIESGALPEAIVTSQKQQQDVQIQIETITAQIQSLQSRLGLSADQAYVSQALTADPIIAQLRVQLYQIESQLALLRQDYRDQHPQVAALIKQKQAAERQLQERASEVLGGDGIAAPLRQADQIRVDSSLDPARQQLAQNLMTLQTQKETLQQQLENLKRIEASLREDYQTLPNKQLEKQRLEQEVLYKKALYDKMKAQLVDSQAAEAETASSLKVAQEAYAGDVEVPEAISMVLILAGGGLAGVVGGAVLIFVLGMLSGKFYTWEEIKGALQEREVPVLGLLPNVMVLEGSSAVMPLILKPHSPYLEYYEKVRSNLQRSGEKPARVVLITSAGDLEGKTFCAYNLAIATARAGKRTLLIEGDLRSPSRVELLKLAPEPLSATEPLRYYGDANNCIRLVPDVENLYVIPSPGPVRQAATVLESSEMKRLLSEVRYRFDMVIIDVPSLNANNDALTLEPSTDGMVLVARPSYTLSGQLGELADQLTEVDEDEDASKYRPRLLGAIINGADLEVDWYDEPTEENLVPLNSPYTQPVLDQSHQVAQLPSKVKR
ncbi:GumC family protein [Capilliphycus salinus ALCB114379]|uniref:GumC family protein n=1 Tax=Capilliphycus salinus TaxID=2768948 RepID=UPI0039A571DC